MTSSSADIQKHQAQSLRHKLRIKRRQLSKIKQYQHSQRISQRIVHSDAYKYARHIAVYLAADGEVDLSFLISKMHQQGKKCYLPVILSRQEGLIGFAPYETHTRLTKNCFAILEPIYQKKQIKTARQMDIVLAPLVAFDNQGNRMGMGGGYYDRALKHLKTAAIKPKFIGIAHELQRVSELQVHSWDIGLNAIVTERCFEFFNSTAQTM